MNSSRHLIGVAVGILMTCIVDAGKLDAPAADRILGASAVDRPTSANTVSPDLLQYHSRTVRWTGLGESDRWLDPANWDLGVPGKQDVAFFENTNAARPVVIDGEAELGHLRVQLPHKRDRLTLSGNGILALNGWETPIPNKYSTALIVTGILDIGPDVSVAIRHQRFIAGNRDGAVVIRSNKVHTGSKAPTSKRYPSDGDDLKFGITDRGRIVLHTPYWEPGMSLDLSASHTVGPKAIEFAHPSGPQGMTFTSLKEHDGDPIEIRGFDPGDFIRFQADPFLSCDIGKEFRVEAVTFVGWSEGGAATVEETDGYWYLKPKGLPQ